MSKIAIVLCAVLFASAANAAVSWERSLKTVQKNVQQVVDNAIGKVEQEYIDGQMKTLTIANELSEGTTKFSEKIWEDLSAVTQKVTIKVSELIGKAEGINVDECLKLSDNLGESAKSAILATSTCVNGQLKNGHSFIDSANKISDEVLAEVSAIKDNAQHCSDKITNTKSITSAIACAKAAASDASRISLQAAPKLASSFTRLQFLLVSLQRNLAVCESNAKLTEFHNDASTVIERTEQCINKKREESQSITISFLARINNSE